MEIPKRFLHDKTILLLLTVVSAALVIGVSLVLLRFDAAKNPTIIAEYRQNLSGGGYLSGKPFDIYTLAIFMFFTAVVGLVLSVKTYTLHRYISVMLLGMTLLLLILATIVSNSLISLQ